MLRSEKASLLLFTLSTYSSATSYPIMFAFANIMRTLFFAHCPSIPHYNNELPEKLLCSPASRDCWFNNCDRKVFTAMTYMDDAAEVTWYVWKNDSDERLSKVAEQGTTTTMICAPTFPPYCPNLWSTATVNKRRQQFINWSGRQLKVVRIMHSCRLTFLKNICVNTRMRYKVLIGSNMCNMSLFIAVLWHTGMRHSIVIASDNLAHSKDTIIAYHDMLIEMIPNSVKTVSIWSDGPAL